MDAHQVLQCPFLTSCQGSVALPLEGSDKRSISGTGLLLGSMAAFL